MKNITLTVIVFALLLSLVSCTQTRIAGNTETSTDAATTEPITPHVDDRILGIYELDSEMYSSSSINLRNPLDISSNSFVDSKVAATKQFVIGQKQLTASYIETVEFKFGECKFEIYSSDDLEFGYREDGTLYAVSHLEGFTKADINENDSLADIRSKLTAAVSDWIDVTEYEVFEGITLGELDESKESMRVKFKKMINGFIVDSVRISIKRDGTIYSIQTHTAPKIDVSILGTIDKEYEREVILAKLKDMYEINGNKLASDDYNVWYAYAIQYEGELYLEYTIYTNRIVSNGTTDYPGCHLLVPVSALIPPTE